MFSPSNSQSRAIFVSNPLSLSQKNVHFPSQEEGGLVTIRVYKRSATPASDLLRKATKQRQTEGESSTPNRFNFPFDDGFALVVMPVPLPISFQNLRQVL